MTELIQGNESLEVNTLFSAPNNFWLIYSAIVKGNFVLVTDVIVRTEKPFKVNYCEIIGLVMLGCLTMTNSRKYCTSSLCDITGRLLSSELEAIFTGRAALSTKTKCNVNSIKRTKL